MCNITLRSACKYRTGSCRSCRASVLSAGRNQAIPTKSAATPTRPAGTWGASRPACVMSCRFGEVPALPGVDLYRVHSMDSC